MLAPELTGPQADVRAAQQLNNLDNSARNWREHINGLAQLVQLHEPEHFSLPGKHEVWLAARENGVWIVSPKDFVTG